MPLREARVRALRGLLRPGSAESQVLVRKAWRFRLGRVLETGSAPIFGRIGSPWKTEQCLTDGSSPMWGARTSGGTCHSRTCTVPCDAPQPLR